MLEIFSGHYISVADQPYLIKINYNTTDIYKIKNDLGNAQKLLSICHRSIFVDNSSQKNSVLIMKNLGKYIFIGQKIYSFTTPDLIIGFESFDNGNSTRPYAIGMKYVYLMLEEIKIPKKYIGTNNPYIWLRHSTSDKKKIKKFKSKPLRNLSNIEDSPSNSSIL